jgi:Spy/CpxP family protein refolding chaperone
MQTDTLTKVVGGFFGALVIAAGVISFAPPLAGAPQDQNQNAPAEGRDGRFGGPRRGGPGGPGGAGRFGGPMGFGINPRDLTDAQREQVKAIHERHAAEMKPLFEQSQMARKALQDNVLAGGTNLRALAIELGKAEGDLAFANAQIQGEVLALLTPEQRQKMQDRAKEMDARRSEMQQHRQSRGAQPAK